MKKWLYDWIAEWLMRHGNRYSEVDHECYTKDYWIIHLIFNHHINWRWEYLFVLLGWNIKLFSYSERK